MGKSTFCRRLQTSDGKIDNLQITRGASRSGAARGSRLVTNVGYELSTDIDLTMLEIVSEENTVRTIVYTTPGQSFVRQAKHLRQKFAGTAAGVVFMFSADEENDGSIEEQLDLVQREEPDYRTYNQRSILVVLNKVDVISKQNADVREKRVGEIEAKLLEFFKKLAENWMIPAYGPIRTSFAPNSSIDIVDENVQKDMYNVLHWINFTVGKQPLQSWEDLKLDDTHWGGSERSVFGFL